jgi:dihydropteroate synthase
MRILQVSNAIRLTRILKDIGVDPYGIRIMLPKAITHLVKINSISNITANILKQEMLSLGGDVAVARDALTGKAKQTHCLLMGNLAQFNRLNLKLRKQPFGLDKVSRELCDTFSNYQKDNFIFNPGSYRLNLGRRTHIMGILNITPDSFSGDGLYGRSISEIMRRAEKLVDDGADIIDVGGESSRPCAKSVSLKEELKRTLPAIKMLRKRIKVPLSIDTRKPEVARAALEHGAVIVNDITGLRNKKMAKLVSKYKAGVVIMHMRGVPRTMQLNPKYESLIDDIIAYLDASIERAKESGIDENKIIIDPGIGFGKTQEHNLEILSKLGELRVLGKSFLGKILKVPAEKRIFGTISACVLAAKNGASLIRVHDVRAVKEALKVFDAVDNI